MGNSKVGTEADGKPGWHLLHRLRQLFSEPAVPGMRRVNAADADDMSTAGLRVLVADDDPRHLKMTSDMLAGFGIGPLLAADGAEAVAMAAELRLDLILMDLQMPVLDGLGATRQIRTAEREEARARVPVVAYTSASGSAALLRDHGFDDVLDKPCAQQSMQACLARWCPPRAGVVERAAFAALPADPALRSSPWPSPQRWPDPRGDRGKCD